jgi:RNA polymerase sigma factor (sigma-70 family)
MEGDRPAAGEGRIVDPADFEIAFEQHFPPIYRFISRRVGTALAEDLVAETFATAYRRRASFEPERASLRAWLYGIATNLVRSHWRAEQHLLALDARLLPETDLADGSDAIDQRVIAALLAPWLCQPSGDSVIYKTRRTFKMNDNASAGRSRQRRSRLRAGVLAAALPRPCHRRPAAPPDPDARRPNRCRHRPHCAAARRPAGRAQPTSADPDQVRHDGRPSIPVEQRP